jgi:hypothetical protein
MGAVNVILVRLRREQFNKTGYSERVIIYERTEYDHSESPRLYPNTFKCAAYSNMTMQRKKLRFSFGQKAIIDQEDHKKIYLTIDGSCA